MNYRLIKFKVNGDEKGSLISIEENQTIPFDIKRLFYIYNTKQDVPRGCHANRQSQFVLVMLNGSCKVKVMTKTKNEVYSLNSPDEGLWLDKMVWKEMYDFSEDAVLLVLSNEHYSKEEYIVDFDEYLKEIA